MRIVLSQPNSPPTRSDAAEAVIGPLSRLPVFLDLNSKRAVVIGGSDAAAWKAELLAMAGASVEVYCPAFDERMAGLLTRGNLAGSARHAGERWDENAFANAAIVVADAANDNDARAIYSAAKRSRVPINLIDRPIYCDFQFGSIVNRSPVVVGISTSGAAPILGQAIRRRIETMLPAALADWGGIALQLRNAVAANLRPGTDRRRFWDAFVTRALAGRQAPHEEDVEYLLAISSSLSEAGEERGRVTLVGVGPGEAELLTLKAVKALQAADVIVFDDLVPAEVLELARREARRMLVGEHSGRPGCRQDNINKMLAALAKGGKNVVWLKSGDPMISGRVGEEISVLKEFGIAVEVVPGVTAAWDMMVASSGS